MLCTRVTEDTAMRRSGHRRTENGEGGTKIELERTWARIRSLHAQRFEQGR
jgi:hypothetical protein